ncbi:MAG: SDR family NAD(P)-dependent oxidoreductase [Rhodospirillales bacterium]
MRTYGRALITGATGGIGTAFAAALPASTDLLLTGRTEAQLAAAAERLRRPGRIVATIAADLAEPAGVDAVAKRADAFGIDLLINNAGLGILGRFLDNDVEGERQTVMVNVAAVVLLTRHLLPGMLERARGAGRRAGLIIVSSTAALAPVPFFASYAATKTFDLHFAEALGEEMREDPIDVLALCPGPIRGSAAARGSFDFGRIPSAVDPERVAREGLAALGRDRVRLVGRVDRAALGPVMLPRRLVATAVGTAMRFFVPERR